MIKVPLEKINLQEITKTFRSIGGGGKIICKSDARNANIILWRDDLRTLRQDLSRQMIDIKLPPRLW